MKTAEAPVMPVDDTPAPEGAETKAMIPKAQLPDCKVGETLKIVDEDDENFIVEPDYEAGEDTGEGDESETPPAVKAIMGQ